MLLLLLLLLLFSLEDVYTTMGTGNIDPAALSTLLRSGKDLGEWWVYCFYAVDVCMHVCVFLLLLPPPLASSSCLLLLPPPLALCRIFQLLGDIKLCDSQNGKECG